VTWPFKKGRRIEEPRDLSQAHLGIKTRPSPSCGSIKMIAKLFDLEDYAGTYRETRNAYLKAANQLKLATGPYKAARDAYVAATATYTKSLYE